MHTRNVVVRAHVHAPHQIYGSQDCTTPTRFCQICHTLQSGLLLQPKQIQKLTLGQHVLHGKSGPKPPITILTFSFFEKSISAGGSVTAATRFYM